MKDLITEARELCVAATPGPWKRGREYEVMHGPNSLGNYSNPINAEFACRSRTLIPELCDALEKAEERGTGCEHCRGWDKRCGASFCPMCGRELEEYHEDD